jgi:hypothetical protein
MQVLSKEKERCLRFYFWQEIKI